MGMRSSMVTSDIKVLDWNRFFGVISLFYDIQKFPDDIKKFIPDTLPELKDKLEEIKSKIEIEAVTRKVCFNETRYESNDLNLSEPLFGSIVSSTDKAVYWDIEGDITFDWDNWKIQGYWYQDFLDFLDLLRFAGVRGTVSLNYETDQDYIINFGDDRLWVRLYEENECDEDGEITKDNYELDLYQDIDLIEFKDNFHPIFMNLKW